MQTTRRILASVTAGIILVAVGLACFIALAELLY